MTFKEEDEGGRVMVTTDERRKIGTNAVNGETVINLYRRRLSRPRCENFACTKQQLVLNVGRYSILASILASVILVQRASQPRYVTHGGECI